MRIFLARHGETEWNAAHRLQGRSDIRLTANGAEHAEALALLLHREPLQAIYTSTLRRTRDTARPLAQRLGLEPEPRAALDELSYGSLEGHTAADPDPAIRKLWAARKADPLGFRAPNGETYDELRLRLLPFVAELQARHADGTALVVGHRATNRVLRALLLGLTLQDGLAFKAKHDCVMEIRPGMEPVCIEHRYAPAAERRSTP